MMLFKILWVIEINYQTVLSFVIGILVGAYLLLLIYAILALMSLRNVKYFKVNPTDTLTEVEAKEMIDRAVRDFKDKTKRGKNSKGVHFKNLCYDLVYGIAKSFFPNSKYPLAEISISEGVELLGYVETRMDEILAKRTLKPFKKMKISTIIDLSKSTKKVVDNKAFRATKIAYKESKKIGAIVSVINPLNLARKIFVSSTLSKVTDKLYMISLSIVGEEAFKIYSKAVLKEELSIDSNVEELASEIDNEIINAKENIEDEEIKELKTNNRRFMTKSLVLNESNEKRNLNLNLNVKFMEIKQLECDLDVQEKEKTN